MRRALMAALLALVLAGCGGGDDGSDAAVTPEDGPSATASDPASENCTDIWVEGETLPFDYDGCVGPDGDVEPADLHECESEIGTFTTYDDEFYALLGDTINRFSGEDDPAYTKAHDACVEDR